MCTAGYNLQSGSRRHLQQTAPRRIVAFSENLDNFLCDIYGAPEEYFEQLSPAFVAHAFRFADDADPCIIEYDINPPKSLQRFLKSRMNLLWISDVQREDEEPRRIFRQEVHEHFRFTQRCNNIVSLLQCVFSYRLTKSSRCASD